MYEDPKPKVGIGWNGLLLHSTATVFVQWAEPHGGLEQKSGVLFCVQAAVSKPAHLIDVSDLDPALPRQEVQHYKFSDEDFKICIVLELDEAMRKEQVTFNPYYLMDGPKGSGGALMCLLRKLIAL